MAAGDLLVSNCHLPCECGEAYQCSDNQESVFNFWLVNNYNQVIAYPPGPVTPPYDCTPTLGIVWPEQETDTPIIIGGYGAWFSVGVPLYDAPFTYSWNLQITYDGELIFNYSSSVAAPALLDFLPVAVPIIGGSGLNETDASNYTWTPNPGGQGGWWAWWWDATVSGNPNPALIITFQVNSPAGGLFGTGELQDFTAVYFSSSGRAAGERKRVRVPLIGRRV